MYSFVVLSAPSARFFLFFVFLFFVPSAQCLASVIPPDPWTRILFGPLLFSFPAFSPEKLCLVPPPLSFFLFFHFGCFFPPGFCAELWLARPGVGKTLVAPPGFYGWICSQWGFSVFRISRLSVLSPPNHLLHSNTFIAAGNFCTFSRGPFCSACVI